MTDRIEEQLSALVDGELPQEEQGLLFKRLDNDTGLRRRWEHYHLIRDALHHELPDKMDFSLAERVQAVLESQPVLNAPHPLTDTLRHAAKPIAGLAIAASVAAMAVVGLQYFSGSGVSQKLVPGIAATQPKQDYAHVAGTRWNLKGRKVAARLNGFLVNHNEYSSSTNLQGMLHYVRIAGYDTERQ